MLEAKNNYVVVLVRPGEESELRSGLFVPPSQREPNSGTVQSVGPDARADLAVGDTVIFPPFGAGVPVRFEGENYLIILDHEILGRVNIGD